MSSNAPLIPPPVQAELDYLEIRKDNTMRVWVRYEDGGYMSFDFGPDSDAMAQLFALVSRICTEQLSRLGGRGVIVSGLTEVPPETEETAG